MTKTRPIIGVTLDSEDAGGYASSPWYALRQNYCGSLANEGGIPVALPHQPDLVFDYLDMVDGIVVTGGGFDISPEMFGQSGIHPTVRLKPGRTEFELALAREALKRDMPVLGICGGHQLLGVILGTGIVQHIPDEIENALDHNPGQKLHDLLVGATGHAVQVQPGTLLAEICGTNDITTNTSHHQALLGPAGSGAVINAVAGDGVVEGIESSRHRFCLGVQWHPEYAGTEHDRRIIQAFVSACSVSALTQETDMLATGTAGNKNRTGG
ncbi:gamma-glutamyl-gamma-aminobutyrate hydrolase family protein [Shimia sp. SDUM112013]|uniref:gamma-glutamyl-gamma-aminobutyrate hydrolase family protein n=1 Tax=Shimia sp. SDUM112013 TaxID=3136160 RepID=UPI0032EFC132